MDLISPTIHLCCFVSGICYENKVKRFNVHYNNLMTKSPRHYDKKEKMARYFVHRDVETGKILRHPWIERGLESGENTVRTVLIRSLG